MTRALPVAHGALCGVVDFRRRPSRTGQRVPTRPAIADRLGERTLATHPVERRVEERLQLHQQRPGVLFARGATLIGWPSADAAFDGEQGGDPLQGLQGDRRGCGMVHLVELSACVAPACNLDQRRLAIGRGWSVEPFEPGISIGMQKAPAGAKQCLRMDAHAIRRVVIERRRWHHRAPGPLVANDNPEPSGFGLSQPGASTGTVVSSACSAAPARTCRPIISARGASRNSAFPTQSASVARSSGTPSRA